MEIIVCDICGSRTKVNRLWFWTGRRMDAAGGYEDEGELYDICEACEFRMLKRIYAEKYANQKENERLIGYIKKEIEKGKKL